MNTTPPWETAEDAAKSGGLGWKKVAVIQGLNWAIQKLRISKKTMSFFMFLVFIGNLFWTGKTFVQDRPKTLFDHFQIARTASFDEIKQAKDLYLKELVWMNNESFDGNMTEYREKYQLDKQQVSDSFNILTNHQLKEVYDKYNSYYA